MAGVWREIRHSSISLSCKQVEIVFQSVFASMEVFSFSYKPMLSWDDFNLCRLLVLRRGQWGKQGWARRLEREKEAALKKRLVKLIKKRFALSATFSSWQSISWLKAYLLAISFFLLCSGKRPCSANHQELFRQGKLNKLTCMSGISLNSSKAPETFWVSKTIFG